MTPKSELMKTLIDRGFVKQATSLDAIDTELSENTVTGYIGFDLTADSLHVGSLTQIMVLRWMKKLGHNPIILLGTATTMIGDPTGKTASRPMLSASEIMFNRDGIQDVLSRLVGDVTFVNNMDWFSKESMIGYLQTYGKHFTVNRMLAFDSVKARLDAQEPFSFLEFNYMLMQAIDFVQLRDRYNCTLQIGGSDQWGNIINGVELARRIPWSNTGPNSSIEAPVVHGLTTWLMTNSSGEKMGKTVNGAVWLDAEKTSPYDFWQFWRTVDDDKVFDFMKRFTEIPLVTIEEYNRIIRVTPNYAAEMNSMKVELANAVTDIVHGEGMGFRQMAAAQAISEGGYTDDIQVISVFKDSLIRGMTLADILSEDQSVTPWSKAEITRLADNGGVRVEGVKWDGKKVRENIPLHVGEKGFVVTIGKRAAFRVKC